jgi:predicted RNase H-like HicB family nuclease
MTWRKLFHRENQCAYPHISAPSGSLELTIALRRGEDGYIVAECVQLPGCMSQGKDEQEAMVNIADAIQSCIFVRLQEILSGSCTIPIDLVGIESQETLRLKAPELEPVTV